MPTIVDILATTYNFDPKDPTSMVATIARLDQMLCGQDAEEDAAEGETPTTEEEPTGSVSSFKLMGMGDM